MVTTAAQVRSFFAQNLVELAQTERSQAELARKIGINRTQLQRFMAGDAFPRPDVLQTICTYFQVDARIYTTPLAELRGGAKPVGLNPFLADVFVPVSKDLLPDGLYIEWKESISEPGKVSHHLLRVSTRDGSRFTQVRAQDPSMIDVVKYRYQHPMNVFVGQAFAQRTGFATIDRSASQQVIALTSFRVGYGNHDEIYPGYKLSGLSYNRHLMHAHGAVVLERLPRTTHDYLAAARLPQYRPLEDTPTLIRRVLIELREERMRRPPNPPGAPRNPHGGVPD